jgi:hypothetical protein
MGDAKARPLRVSKWAVARRLDWPNAKRPFFLFGGPGGLYTYHGRNGGAVFFKTQESAQGWADKMNAAGYDATEDTKALRESLV